MVDYTHQTTAEEFDRFVKAHELDDCIYELIAGEIIEVSSNPYASKISMRFAHRMSTYLDDHDIGNLTGEAGGYMVSGERYAPDVAFISYAKQAEVDTQGYNTNPPDLVVEVDFPSSAKTRRNLGFKIINYLLAGTVVWVAYPESKEIEIYIPGQSVQVIGIEGELDGGSVLPGFKLAVKDIFK